MPHGVEVLRLISRKWESRVGFNT